MTEPVEPSVSEPAPEDCPECAHKTIAHDEDGCTVVCSCRAVIAPQPTPEPPPRCLTCGDPENGELHDPTYIPYSSLTAEDYHEFTPEAAPQGVGKLPAKWTDDDLYDAYLRGCEDDAVPEPLSKGTFLASWEDCADVE